MLAGLAAREHDLVEFARELVAIPSPNPPGDERKVAERARFEMAELGYAEVREVAMEPGRPNVVGDVVGARSGPVLILNGHLDTKPAGDLSEWAIGPYDPVVTDGRLHGLGSTDMKGAVAAMVYAGAAIAEVGAPAGTVRVVLTADEEGGSRFGARFLAGQPEFASQAVIVGEPTGMESPWAYLAVASRGISCFRVTVRGTQMHSSLSDQVPSVNASVKLSQVMSRMASEFKPRFPVNSEVPGGPTVNLGVTLSGGVYFGVYPGHAEFGIDVRTVPGMTHASIGCAARMASWTSPSPRCPSWPGSLRRRSIPLIRWSLRHAAPLATLSAATCRWAPCPLSPTEPTGIWRAMRASRLSGRALSCSPIGRMNSWLWKKYWRRLGSMRSRHCATWRAKHQVRRLL
ncbi:MAG: M20 family metallopeptidase [Chloroflexi bacterium]|nr:MAG: M20 family metallopeptidase [Chloroflexota bacterium]